MSEAKRCVVCGQPPVAGFDLCGPCLTGDAATAGETLAVVEKKPKKAPPPAVPDAGSDEAE